MTTGDLFYYYNFIKTNVGEFTMISLVAGNTYKWKHEPQNLIYIGKKNGWHQFTLNDSVWCEVLDSDLFLMEKVNA